MSYWYNVDTGQVESDADRSRGEQVLGPYATEEEARGALAKARENTERWDDEDRNWGSGTPGTGATGVDGGADGDD